MKFKSNFYLTGMVFLLAISNENCQNKPGILPDQKNIKLESFPKAKKVDIIAGGKLFTSYLYSDMLEKPVLFPIVAADDITITRGFPIAPREGEQTDHPHHTGFWFGYGNVNGIDFWGNSKWIPVAEKLKYGIIRFKSINKIKSNADKGILEVSHEWVNPGGIIALEEHVTFIFKAGKDYRIIDRITTLTAELPEVTFADTKEGAFALRVARFLEFPSGEPKTFTDAFGKVTNIPVLNNEGINGNYLSSEGIKGAGVWSTRARWMKLYAVNASDTVSIVFMDHPSNLNYPTFWHARDYGLFSANPFGQKDFTKGKEELNFKLKKGESVTFRHRLYIRSGNDFKPSEIEKCWKDFSENLN
jgi:hypothetical protein